MKKATKTSNRVKKIKKKLTHQFITKSIEGPRVMLESSFVLAVLNEEDSNHKCTKAVFNFISLYNCRFHIPMYVYAEVLSNLIQGGKTVAESLKIVDIFLNKIPGSLIIGSSPNLEELKNRYRQLARKKVRLLRSNDFYIATEGMLSGALMLTCDYEMYTKMKKYYPDVFYVATHSKKYKNDIPCFTERFLQISEV